MLGMGDMHGCLLHRFPGGDNAVVTAHQRWHERQHCSRRQSYWSTVNDSNPVPDVTLPEMLSAVTAAW